MDPSKQVVMVTGAGRGFGWGVANALGRAGAKVCVTDIEAENIDRCVRDISEIGGVAWGRYLDVADGDDFQQAVDEVLGRWGRIDALVHSAIYMPLVSFEDLTRDSWWRQIHVGLGGLFNGSKAVWDAMTRQGGGHIIGVASGSSVRGYKDEVAYCAIKHAQEGFVKALALEGEPRNIAINTIGPGKPIKTTRVTWEELEGMSAEETAAWVDPAELGRAFVWLCAQPPDRFSGLRFDAGPIMDTIDREGEDFAFAVEKVTLYQEDFRARHAWRSEYSD